MLLFVIKNTFVPIPDEFKIGFGDDWIFNAASNPMQLDNLYVKTNVETTSSSPEFKQQIQIERDWFMGQNMGYIPYHFDE